MGKVISAVCAVACTLSCSRSARRGEQIAAPINQARATQTLNAGQPVRVSAENTDAAEPTVAAGGDDTAYVAWGAHRAGGAADVWRTTHNQAAAPLA
jgi:hypothetical protein